MAMTNAQKQKAYRVRLYDLVGNATRLHEVLSSAADSGNMEAAQLVGDSATQTLANLADDAARRFGVSAVAHLMVAN